MNIKIIFTLLFLWILVCNGCERTSTPGGGNKCELESCNGLDVTCGPNAPEVCYTMYQLGDFCREYVGCEIIDGECQLVKDPKFDMCKGCVDECNKLEEMEAFDCEDGCRELLK